MGILVLPWMLVCPRSAWIPPPGRPITEFDNTGALSANTWRHLAFIERSVRDLNQKPFQSGWLMIGDVCKHCHNAPCLEACSTGAIFRTEFDTVVVRHFRIEL